MADFHVKIISSNRTFYEGVCHCLILPAVDGEMAVMAHHESEIVAVKAGEMRFQATEDGPWEALLLQVLPQYLFYIFLLTLIPFPHTYPL